MANGELIDTENSSKENIVPSYSDQCYLLDYVTEISSWKDPQRSKLDPSLKNIILTSQDSVDSVAFFNRITAEADMQGVLEFMPQGLRKGLIADVRMYKVFPDGHELRIPLKNVTKKTKLEEAQKDKVAIRSFSWDYLGTQPAEVDYFINCQLVLYFPDTKKFFEAYTDKDGYSWSYKDLIVRAPSSKITKDTHRAKDQKDFRIRVVVRYATLNSDSFPPGTPSSMRKKIKRFVSSLETELFLSLTKNTVKPLVSSGRGGMRQAMELTLDYVGAVENAFLSPKANILLAPETDRQSLVREEYESSVKDLELDRLEGQQLSDTQKATIRKLTLQEVEEGKTTFFGFGESNAGQIEDVLEEAIGKEGADTEKQAGEVLKFLKEKKSLTEKAHLNGMLVKETVLSKAYSRVLRTLRDNKKLYFIKRTNEQLLEHFQARNKVRHLSEARIADLEKKSTAPETINTDEGKRAKDTLDKYYDSKRKARDIQTSASQDLNVGTATGMPDGSELYKNKFKSIEEHIKATESKREDTFKELQEISTLEEPQKNSDDRYIMFFYFGDMLDIVLDFLQENSDALGLDLWNSSNPDEGKIRFVLGNIDYSDPITNLRKSVNIADVPISVELWDTWWHNKVVKNLADNYPFKAFLRDSLISLVKNAFTNRCKSPGQTINQISLNVDHIPFRNSSVKFFSNKNRWFAQALKPEPAPFTPYTGEMVFVYAASNNPGSFSGNREEDNSYGIYHINAVGGKGTVLTEVVQFTKTDQPFLLEAKADTAGIMKDDTMLSEPYNASFKTLGFSIWRPGKYVYIYFPQVWMDERESKMLGLGGYYLITKASHNLTPPGGKSGNLKWDCNVELKWTQFADSFQPPDPVHNVQTPPFPPAVNSSVREIDD